MGLNDGNWLPGGLRAQSFIPRTVGGRDRSLSRPRFGVQLGLVVDIHYKDEDENLHKMFTEYEVYLVMHNLLLRNVPQAASFQGESNGSEATLKAAGGVPDLSNVDSAWDVIMSSSGDLVLVSWIDDRWPIITGCVNHLRRTGEDSAPWYATSSEGPRAAIHYNDVDVVVDNDSNVRIDIEDSKVVEFYVDGTLALKVFNDAGTVRVDMGNGAEKVILGETFRTWFNLNYSGHMHDVSGISTVGGDTIAPGQFTSPYTEDMPANHLSDVTKTE